MKKLTIFVIAVLTYTFSFSQAIVKPVINRLPDLQNAAKKTNIQSANRINIPIQLSSTDTTLFPVITSVNPRPKIEQYYLRDFAIFKDTAKLIYNQSIENFQPQVPNPFRIKNGFDANIGDNSAPLDNTIGCSGDNNIVSVSNNYIEYRKDNSVKFKSDLSSFINYEIASPCDPKVYFDPTANRFILFMQSCNGDFNKSQILIGFSISSDPLDGWNFYKLSGNPLNKLNHWFDYPKVGISQDGLFISGNIFIGSNGGLAQTVLYQIDKNLGYSGQQIKYRVWYDIADKPFTIMPVNYAFNNTYGKGVYLLSTTWQVNADYIKMYDITGDIYNNSSMMNFYKVQTTPYNFFADAVQLNRPIDNGDIRMQDAILCNNKIYFAFTSGNDRKFSRVNFNILDIQTLQNRSTLIGDNANYSYAYPSLNIFSEENESTTVLLQYNATSNQSYPEIRCKTCDDNFNCSQELVVKAGESIINNFDRWGDYSGIAKNHTNKNQLWLSSSYGKNDRRQTYIANIVASNQPSVPTDSLKFKQLYSAKSINFNLTTKSDIRVVLKSANKQTTIFEGRAEKGDNLFEIFTNKLRKGDYTIEVLKKSTNTKLNSTVFKTE
jgi:hypothetical protein